MNLDCNGWFNLCGNELSTNCDTALNCQVGFYRQSPSPIPEDIWSLKLEAGWHPAEGLAQTYITGQSGTKVYQLSFVMKSNVIGANPAFGSAGFGIYSQGAFTAAKTIGDTTSVWKRFTIIDTLTTEATDTIAVKLSAGMCEVCLNIVYFDLIELVVTDDLTAIETPDQPQSKPIKIYPNPASQNITFELPDPHHLYTLTIYSPTGQLVKTIQTSQNRITIDKGNIAAGLYFYQVRSEINGHLFGEGKFIWE